MKKFLSILMVLMMAIGLMIPAFASAGSDDLECMWVNCEDGKRLNVRAYPGKNAPRLYQLECGTKLYILDNAGNGWVHVTTGKQDAGYVMSKFLVSSKPGKYEITEREDNFRSVNPYQVTALARGKNTEQSVGLRVKPNKTAQAIRRLEAGDRLEVIAVGKTWSRVRDLATGRTGYVANDYITRA